MFFEDAHQQPPGGWKSRLTGKKLRTGGDGRRCAEFLSMLWRYLNKLVSRAIR
ncbi:MAG: hypothetical protein ACLUD0_10260 [Eubacterium ramulus]